MQILAYTPLYYFFHKKYIVQDFLMYNGFAKKSQRKVPLFLLILSILTFIPVHVKLTEIYQKESEELP